MGKCSYCNLTIKEHDSRWESHGLAGFCSQKCQSIIFPAECKAARALLGLTQAQLAKASKVSLTSIRIFEGGGCNHRLKLLAKIKLTLSRMGVEFKSTKNKLGLALSKSNMSNERVIK